MGNTEREVQVAKYALQKFIKELRDVSGYSSIHINDLLALAEWEKSGRLEGIITQNIDGLHQKAGSVNVAEIHGTIWKNHCVSCDTEYDVDFIFDSKEVFTTHYADTQGFISKWCILRPRLADKLTVSDSKISGAVLIFYQNQR